MIMENAIDPGGGPRATGPKTTLYRSRDCG
jgi:hypothetical protein